MSTRDLAPWWMAAGAWCGALIALLGGQRVGVALGAAVAAAAAAVALGLALARRGTWPVVGANRWPQSPTVMVALLVLVPLAAGAVGGAVRVLADERSPLAPLAARGASADVELRVVGDARPLRDGSGERPEPSSRVLVEVRTDRILVDGTSIRARSRTTVIGPPAWGSLRVGERVRAVVTWTRAPGPLVAVRGSARADPVVIAPAGALDRAVDGIRRSLRDSSDGVGGDGASLVPALVLGDTALVPERVADSMRDAGLAHLSAVSGANVAIMLGAVLLLARLLGARGRGLTVVGLVAIGGFAVLTRLEPSVLRASAMAFILLLAAWRGGTSAARRALPTAALVLLLIDPGLALAPGFVLSVAATAGLLLVAPWVLAQRRGRPARLLAATVAAQLAVAPVLAGLGGRIDAGGLIANLLAEPLVAPTTVLGLAAAAVAPWAPAIATVIAAAASVPATLLLVVAGAVSSSRWSVLPWPPGLLGAVLMGVLLLAAAGSWRHVRVGRNRGAGGGAPRAAPRVAPRVGGALLLLAVLVGVVVLPVSAERGWPPPGWRVVQCDVGQGDAVVLAAEPARAIVIDAGPDARLVDGCLRDLGITHVPLLVLTHFHADHVGGVAGVMRGRRVDEVLVAPWPEPRSGVEAVARAASGRPVRTAQAGAQVEIGPWRLTILGPTDLDPDDGSAPNNASVLLRADQGAWSVLLLGDAELQAQRRLLRSVPADVLDVEVLKVAHHGSAVQDPSLIAASGARVALLGVGCGNRYGHPAASTLALLARSGMTIGRTDRDGAVAVLADGRVMGRGPQPGRVGGRCPDDVGGA